MEFKTVEQYAQEVLAEYLASNSLMVATLGMKLELCYNRNKDRLAAILRECHDYARSRYREVPDIPVMESHKQAASEFLARARDLLKDFCEEWPSPEGPPSPEYELERALLAAIKQVSSRGVTIKRLHRSFGYYHRRYRPRSIYRRLEDLLIATPVLWTNPLAIQTQFSNSPILVTDIAVDLLRLIDDINLKVSPHPAVWRVLRATVRSLDISKAPVEVAEPIMRYLQILGALLTDGEG